MPPTDINTNAMLRRLQNTGEILFVDGANEYKLNNREPGTLKFKPPKRQPLPRTDNSALQTPMEGDMQPGSFSVTARFVKADGANELINQIMERPATITGFVKEFTIKLRVYDPDSSTVGVQAVLTVYAQEAPQLAEGRDYDMVEFNFVVRDWTPWATF